MSVHHSNELYIGALSGTSADGIDVALFDFADEQIKLVAKRQQAFEESLRTNIIKLTQPGHNELDIAGHTDIEIAKAFAHAVKELLEEQNIHPQSVKAIGSHGQTVRHRASASTPFTWQIGDPNTIAQLTGITTVADFRRRDIAAGGQGAPLAPAFHHAVFSSKQERRCIINIGGIANISVLATDPTETLGYDTGPGNVLLDAWIQKHLNQDYDHNGKWAASGNVQQQLLEKLCQHPYLDLGFPKSTGREEFHLGWLENVLSYEPDIASEDVQATLCEFTARTIRDAILLHSCDTVFICGGGAHNNHLLSRLSAMLPKHAVSTTDTLGIHVDWVEAGLFAWLARQTMRHCAGNLPSVTGAHQAVVLGGIFL